MRPAVLTIFFALQMFQNLHAAVEVTNIVCRSIDKPYADFEYCYIKAINRTYKYVSVKVNLFKVPVYNFSANFAFMRKANGYKPFLYNFTADGCKYLRERKNPLHNYVFDFMKPFTNINHTCPIDHDVIVDKMHTRFLDNQLTKVLPVPEGEYAVFTTWFAYNIPKAYVNIFVKIF